jgi:hypothetical protein
MSDMLSSPALGDQCFSPSLRKVGESGRHNYKIATS